MTNTTAYEKFLQSKKIVNTNDGIIVELSDINQKLYPFQQQLVQWSLKKGKSAIFADCGLGKTFMQLEWARLLNRSTLIVAPLAVANQTQKEGEKLGIKVDYVRDQSQIKSLISITNYEMIEHFDPDKFEAIVLDESSILKSVDGKTKKKLIEFYNLTPYKLCCTATPAPNDVAEFANHAEFLNIATRQEMLSMFFVNDASHGEGWRLKGHAKESFYRWLASWAIFLRTPSDIGFSDEGYILPELNIYPQFIEGDSQQIAQEMGQLFVTSLSGIQGRSRVRKMTIGEKVEKSTEIISQSPDQWIIWCGLNDEGRELHKSLNGQSILIEGADKTEKKLDSINKFVNGEIKCLITKIKICGFGLNLQNCHNQLFLGMNDSYEMYYQATRRSWRFGQKSPVDIHIILSELETVILENVRRKEKQIQEVIINMISNISQFQKEELGLMNQSNREYKENLTEGNNYQLYLGDCVEQMKNIKDESVDFSIFSPPFLSLYVYSDTERDMGNSKNEIEFFKHFNYFLSEHMRITKPGRITAVHVAQVGTTLSHDGFIGIKDFRGKTIQSFIDAGFNYHGDITIDKNPQAQAIRNHVKSLLFVQLRKDASWLRPGLADYLLIFRKPGEPEVPVKPNITNDQWVQWAHPIWYDISETDVLNVRPARSEEDERHMCPLQLGLIERAIHLWTNPGEVVFSPFAGIGSEGYEAIKNNRRFIGIELKPEYHKTAIRNLEQANTDKNQGELKL